MWITPTLEHTRLHMFCWGGINNGVVAKKNKALVLNAWWDIIAKLQALWQCSDHGHMICEYHLHVPYTYIMRNICSSLVQVSADDIVLLHCAETWERFSMSTMCLQAGCIFHTSYWWVCPCRCMETHMCTHAHTHTHTHTPQMVTWQGCGRHSTQQVYPKTNHWGHSLQTYIKLHAKQSVYTRIYYNSFSFSLSPQTSIAPHSMVSTQQQTMVCTLTP